MYTGLTGALYILDSDMPLLNAERVAYISGWSIENSTDMVEVNTVGQAHTDAYAGRQSWSASADGVVVFENKGQEKLFIAKSLGKKMRLNFYMDLQASGGTYFTGCGYIESLGVDLSAESAANISISVKGLGQLDLIVDGEDVITQAKKQEMFFKFKLNEENGKLLVTTDEINDYRFDKDEDGYLRVVIGKQ